MHTLRLLLDSGELTSPAASQALARAGHILRDGGTVAFPTETVYGLGADALQENAVAKIFAAKQRPSWDPLIVHISDDPAMLQRVIAGIPPQAERLIRAFWPGPLTLLLPKNPAVPNAVTAGRERVGVRMPAHPVAMLLLKAAGTPIAAPSANRFGHTSPTTAQYVLDDLDGRIDALLDCGEATYGLESTVVDACEEPCIMYRPGVISIEQMRAAGVEVVAFRGTIPTHEQAPESLPSPGVGIRHYAPRAKLILIDGEGIEQQSAFARAAQEAQKYGKTGLMLPDEFSRQIYSSDAILYRWGRWENYEELAHRLFAGLRYLDGTGAAVIVCPLPQPRGIGEAMRDRLMKAAREA